MRRLACLAMCAASCYASGGGDDYPVVPGSGPSPPSGTSGGTAVGRVCRAPDMRAVLSGCASSGVGGLTITLGDQTATTDDTGQFELPIPIGSTMDLSYTVSGPGIVPTSTPFNPNTSSGGSVPAIDADLYNRLLAANGIVLAPGSGSILSSVFRRGVPVGGVTMRSTPSPAFGPFYDGSTPDAWTLNGTGARGVIWAPGVAMGTTSVTFSDLATSTETTVDGVQVINGGVTILDSVLP
jgi:hypothetical protein